MPVVEGYNITQLTLNSLLKHLNTKFNKFIIISCGTEHKELYELLINIALDGYQGLPKEKFKVVFIDKEHMLSGGESFNLMTSFLEPDEDVLCTANNNLFGKDFMPPLLRCAYDEPYSSNVFCVTPTSIFNEREDIFRMLY